MTSILDNVISATQGNGNGASIVSQNHDKSQINWARGMSDPGEMIACGYLPQLRRLSGESDDVYAARILPMVLALPQHERDTILNAAVKAANQRANLMTVNGKVAMFSSRETPWHSLGTVVSQCANRSEMLEFSQLANWNLEKVEQQIMWNGQLIPTGSYAVVRGMDGVVMTAGKSVGRGYTIFSNEDGAEFADTVLQSSGAHYETAGAIANGSTVWMLARMPQDVVVAPGDELRQYLLLGLSHDGSSAIWATTTDVRTVCENTYRVAMSGGNKRYSFRHTKNVASRAIEVSRMLGIATKSQAEFASKAKQLANTPMADPNEYFQDCLDDIVQVTIAGQQLNRANYNDGSILKSILAIQDTDAKHTAEKALERAVTRRKDVLADILERYESDRNNGLSSIAGSSWAALNAVTEFADHSELNRFKGSPQDRAESRFSSVIDGRADEIKQAAIARLN